MDSNTFALFVLGFATVIVSIIIWQIFVTVRSRRSVASEEVRSISRRTEEDRSRLDARLTALAHDVEAIERRVAHLEVPPSS